MDIDWKRAVARRHRYVGEAVAEHVTDPSDCIGMAAGEACGSHHSSSEVAGQHVDGARLLRQRCACRTGGDQQAEKHNERCQRRPQARSPDKSHNSPVLCTQRPSPGPARRFPARGRAGNRTYPHSALSKPLIRVRGDAPNLATHGARPPRTARGPERAFRATHWFVNEGQTRTDCRAPGGSGSPESRRQRWQELEPIWRACLQPVPDSACRATRLTSQMDGTIDIPTCEITPPFLLTTN